MIFPSAGDELDLPALAEAYAYPRERWLRTNFVSSADGAAYVDGRAGPLSSGGDKRVFGVLRVLADVVLVGAGTARAEEYKPARRRPSLASLRAGRPETATIALVTRTVGLDLASPLFTEAPPDARTIVITCAASDAELRAQAAKVADVKAAGLLAELCLSLSPTMAGPGASRVVAGQHSDAQGMRLAHVLAEDDGFLFLRYVTQEREP